MRGEEQIIRMAIQMRMQENENSIWNEDERIWSRNTSDDSPWLTKGYSTDKVPLGRDYFNWLDARNAFVSGLGSLEEVTHFVTADNPPLRSDWERMHGSKVITKRKNASKNFISDHPLIVLAALWAAWISYLLVLFH